MKSDNTLARKRNVRRMMGFAVMTLLPMIGFCQKHITTPMLLESLKPGESWDRGLLTLAKTAVFNQTPSGGSDASAITGTQLGFFTSTDCSGPLSGTGFYVTPSAGPSFSISPGTPFGLTQAAAWNVGFNELRMSSVTMGTIQSIAMTFKATGTGDIHPQSNFSGNSYACITGVSCNSSACLSSSGIQNFTLKTTEAVGDPADGGVIACLNGGLNNLVAPTSDNNGGVTIQWGGDGITTGATSTTDGAANTTAIVTCLTNGTGCTGGGGISINAYAAGICSTYSANGGYTSGWFLPAGNNTTLTGQQNCLYTNSVTIGGFAGAFYWSSNESYSDSAWVQFFIGGTQLIDGSKSDANPVRCVRGFTP